MEKAPLAHGRNSSSAAAPSLEEMRSGSSFRKFMVSGQRGPEGTRGRLQGVLPSNPRRDNIGSLNSVPRHVECSVHMPYTPQVDMSQSLKKRPHVHAFYEKQNALVEDFMQVDAIHRCVLETMHVWLAPTPAAAKRSTQRQSSMPMVGPCFVNPTLCWGSGRSHMTVCHVSHSQRRIHWRGCSRDCGGGGARAAFAQLQLWQQHVSP
jgi:hypothetical protein